MAEHGICDQCKDRKKPVTAQNGGTLSSMADGQKIWVADVHESCKGAWLSANSKADFGGLQALKKV